jgi:hypothetical protein
MQHGKSGTVFVVLSWLSLFLRVIAADNVFGVKLDRSAAKNGYTVFSVIHERTSEGQDIDGMTLAKIAVRAWLDMDDILRNEIDAWNKDVSEGVEAGVIIAIKKKNRQRPATMTALLTREKVYLASSSRQEGADKRSFLLNIRDQTTQETIVLQALRRCEMYAGTEERAITGHVNSANCGEMSLLRRWELSNLGHDVGDLADTRIVTVSKNEDGFYIKAPCGSDTEKGCDNVMRKLSIQEALGGDTRVPPENDWDNFKESLHLGRTPEYVDVFGSCQATSRRRRYTGYDMLPTSVKKRALSRIHIRSGDVIAAY